MTCPGWHVSCLTAPLYLISRSPLRGIVVESEMHPCFTHTGGGNAWCQWPPMHMALSLPISRNGLRHLKVTNWPFCLSLYLPLGKLGLGQSLSVEETVEVVASTKRRICRFIFATGDASLYLSTNYQLRTESWHYFNNAHFTKYIQCN